MKNAGTRLLLCVIGLIAMTTGIAADRHSPAFAEGHSQVWRAGKFKVQAITAQVTLTKSADYEGWWGVWEPEETPQPVAVIQHLRVWYAGKPLRVFRSFYCDLADVRSIEVSESKSACVIHIFGSDTGEAYIATITVHTRNQVERVVKDREMPEIYESTKFRPVLRTGV